MNEAEATMPPPVKTKFDIAEMGAIAHLYRGEVYRSTIWRTRLDQTTNWAVVTTGLAMSLTFSGPYASPLPLILVGLLVVVFLLLESRRYRYFSVWRARCRLMETDLYAPMLRGRGGDAGRQVEHAAGRRLRAAAVPCQLLAGDRAAAAVELRLYPGRSRRSPTTASSRSTRCRRGIGRPSSRAPRSGRCPGWFVVLCGLAFHGSWVVIAIVTYQIEKRRRMQAPPISM